MKGQAGKTVWGRLAAGRMMGTSTLAMLLLVLCCSIPAETTQADEKGGWSSWRPSMPKLKAPSMKMPKLKAPSTPQWAKKGAKSVSRGTKQAWGTTKNVVSAPFQGFKDRSESGSSPDYRTARSDDRKSGIWGGWGKDKDESSGEFETMKDFVGGEKLRR